MISWGPLPTPAILWFTGKYVKFGDKCKQNVLPKYSSILAGCIFFYMRMHCWVQKAHVFFGKLDTINMTYGNHRSTQSCRGWKGYVENIWFNPENVSCLKAAWRGTFDIQGPKFDSVLLVLPLFALKAKFSRAEPNGWSSSCLQIPDGHIHFFLESFGAGQVHISSGHK